MATRIAAGRGGISPEHRFFMLSGWVMAAVIVAGFSVNLLLGRSSFAVPWIYHVHAFFFFGWVVLYLLQTGLVAAGNIPLHRRLGWLAAAWIPAMVVLGTAMTINALRLRGGPPFFDTNEFLFGNILGIFYFGGMAAAAIVMRRKTAWHRRLMFCGMAALTGPGLGRLLPMPFLIPWAWWASQSLALLFAVAGMISDRRRTGQVHPAWFWGIALFLAAMILGDILAYSPSGVALTRAVLAGAPGDHADLHAHFPRP